MQEIFRFVDQHGDRFMVELCTLVRQPSISAQNVGVAECAALLKSQLEAIGVAAWILPTAGHPVVFGEVQAPGTTRTLLRQGHVATRGARRARDHPRRGQAPAPSDGAGWRSC